MEFNIITLKFSGILPAWANDGIRHRTSSNLSVSVTMRRLGGDSPPGFFVTESRAESSAHLRYLTHQ